MTAALRIGVVGVGSFGERHLAAYARRDDVVVVGVADEDEGRAEAAARRHGVERWFRSADDLLAACEPHGISVATPGSRHLLPTLAALDAGCSVLLEKPVALSSGDFATLERAALGASAFVMPAHILRFAAPYVALRARLAAGELGRLLGVSTVRDRGRDHHRRFPDVHPAFMTSIHDIDVALWMTGARPLRVSAHARRAAGLDAPALVWASVEADDGSVWSLRVSWLLPDGATAPDRLELYGEDGAGLLELRPSVAVLAAGAEPVDDVLTPATHAGALDAEIDHFCSCLRTGSAPTAVTLADAGTGIRVAEAIVASADAGGETLDVAP